MRYSPRLLINVSLLLAVALFLVDLGAILYPPYTGFQLAEVGSTGRMQVVRMDAEVAARGLALGDQIVSISSSSGQSVQMGPQYFQAVSVSMRDYFPNRVARIEGFDEVNQILTNPPVTLTLGDGRSITLPLDKQRPLANLSVNTWVLIILGISVPVMASLVWAWQPEKPETRLLLVSGIGYYLFNFTGVASIYNIEMYFPSAVLHWLSRTFLDLGQMFFAAFGSAVLLYYPTRFKFAGRAVKAIAGFALLYPASIYLGQYLLNGFGDGHYPGFTDPETVFFELLFFVVTITLGYLQFKHSRHRPVQRAQTLWIILAWTIGPSIYIFFRVIPRQLGIDPLLQTSISMNLLILLTYVLVLIGVARLDLFKLEQHIAQAYQWVLISIGFFALDFLLVSYVNIAANIAAVIVIGAILWGYLPLRQWFHQRYLSNQVSQNLELLNTSVVSMVKESLVARSGPGVTWRNVIENALKPGSISALDDNSISRVTERGQRLIVRRNLHSPSLCLEFADGGSRLFNRSDVVLVDTLGLLFEKLYDVRDAFLAGQTQERSRIRRDLHDQVGHKLLSLIYAAPDNKTRNIAQETMAQLSELIQALRHEPIHLADLLSRIHKVCEDSARTANLTFKWQSGSAEVPDILITSDQYLNILNILRELLNNTVKHAGANTVTVGYDIQGSALCVSYSDDGSGFDQARIKPGNGLFNIQNRCEELNARIKWDTESGTKLTIEIPMRTEGNPDE